MPNWMIILSASLIAIAIYAASFTGRYEIAGQSDMGLWRLDRMSGRVNICYFAKSDNPFDDGKKIKCTDYVGENSEITSGK